MVRRTQLDHVDRGVPNHHLELAGHLLEDLRNVLGHQRVLELDVDLQRDSSL